MQTLHCKVATNRKLNLLSLSALSSNLWVGQKLTICQRRFSMKKHCQAHTTSGDPLLLIKAPEAPCVRDWGARVVKESQFKTIPKWGVLVQHIAGKEKKNYTEKKGGFLGRQWWTLLWPLESLNFWESASSSINMLAFMLSLKSNNFVREKCFAVSFCIQFYESLWQFLTE